jgi:hypothetical protein
MLQYSFRQEKESVGRLGEATRSGTSKHRHCLSGRKRFFHKESFKAPAHTDHFHQALEV